MALVVVARTLIVLAGLHASPSLAQTTPAGPPDVIVEGQVPEAKKRVCKQTTSTGSIIPTRTCKTKAEWEEIRERSIALLEQLKDQQEREQYLRELLGNQ